MTKEQYVKATELNEKIENLKYKIESITYRRAMKISKDREARRIIEERERLNPHHEEWTISKFFKIIFHKRKVKLLAHYEFAEAIELDADAELIDLILDYLQKQKADLEKEFEQIGGGIE